jgi:hypothetical protein
MAAKPSGALSVVIVVLASALGVALSRWQIAMLSRTSPASATEPAATSS